MLLYIRDLTLKVPVPKVPVKYYTWKILSNYVFEDIVFAREGIRVQLVDEDISGLANVLL
jgi:hypothetical protein